MSDAAGAAAAGPGATPDDADCVLVARDVVKTYGGVQALRGVRFRARTGMVNVLVGENGAGKSTLMKILSGTEQPSSGEILLDGEPVEFRSPREAMARGIGIIHQELSLFGNLSVTDNLFAGRELHRAHLIDRAEQRRQTVAALARLRQTVDPDTLVGDLPIGTQQLVEIARVLSQDVRILIMDEPTSALSNAEVDVLFEVMADLRQQDVTVIYISHKLDEFRRIGDHVTVLRDGSLVAEAPMSETDTGWIVQNMVGRSEASLFSRTSGTIGAPVLEVEHLSVPGKTARLVDDVSLRVHAGEIVGVYGLMGAGRTELMEALIGSRATSEGRVVVDGKAATRSTVSSRLRLGLALVPEDRQRDGLVQVLSVRSNIVLATLRDFTRGLLSRPGAERRTAREQVAEWSIKVPGTEAPVTSLSGGNQQKVVLSRALLTKPKVLLLDEPTRGIDVGAKTEIFRIMSSLADAGLGVLFVSSELVEVMSMSDRVLVMARGRITAELSKSQITEERLVAASASDSVLEVTA